MEVAEYIIELKDDKVDKRQWQDNKPRVFNLILIHCPQTQITKIEDQPGYDACKDARDPVALITSIRDITHKHDITKNKTKAIVELDMELYLGQQGKTNSIDEHYQRLKSRVDTIITHGGLGTFNLWRLI